MPKCKYLAISLGPIYATITKASKTRELWAASYLFSGLMQEIYNRLMKKVTVLSPLPPLGYDRPPFGTGIFPDRLFAEAGTLRTDELDVLLEGAINAIAEKALPDLKGKVLNYEYDGQVTQLHYERSLHLTIAKQFWHRYFRIVKVWKTLDPASDNILLTLNAFLDTAELRPVYFSEEPETDYCLALLDYPYKTKLSLALHDRGIYEDIMPKNSLFPSTAEIAAFELFRAFPEKAKELLYGHSEKEEKPKEDGKTDEEQLEVAEEQLESFYSAIYQDDTLRKRAADYHKYYCIVHVDGDNFGKVLGSFSGPDQIEKVDAFSKHLAEFAVDAANAINKYGGKPVYIGGDDLLFFAPLRAEISENEQGKIVSLLDIVETLDDDFNRFIQKLKLPEGTINPTLSYGISISYYKYPLFEAHQLSYNQLADRAKKFSKGEHKKNAVAFRFLKHSGSYFEGILTKEQFLGMKAILEMIDQVPGEFFSSIAFKLDTLAALVNGMVDSNSLSKSRLEALFNNFFDEPVHRLNDRRGLHTIEGLTQTLFEGNSAKIDDKTIDPANNLYSVLRLLMFMTSSMEKNKPVNKAAHV